MGTAEFQKRYFSALTKFVTSFAQNAPQWGLSSQSVERAFNQYFASAVKLIAIAQSGNAIEPEEMGEMLKSITKADFGMTAIFLVFDGSVTADELVISKTFESTVSELARYDSIVSEIWAKLGMKSTVAGTLQVEGDLDEALQSFNPARSSLFSAQKQPQ